MIGALYLLDCGYSNGRGPRIDALLSLDTVERRLAAEVGFWSVLLLVKGPEPTGLRINGFSFSPAVLRNFLRTRPSAASGLAGQSKLCLATCCRYPEWNIAYRLSPQSPQHYRPWARATRYPLPGTALFLAFRTTIWGIQIR